MKLRKTGQISRRAKKGKFPWLLLLIIMLMIGFAVYWLYENPPDIPELNFSAPGIDLSFLQSQEKRLIVLYIPGLDAALYNQWIGGLDTLQSIAETGSYQELEPIQPSIPEHSWNAFVFGNPQIGVDAFYSSLRQTFLLHDGLDVSSRMPSWLESSASINTASSWLQVLNANDVSTAVFADPADNSRDLQKQYQTFLQETTDRKEAIVHDIEEQNSQCIIALWHSTLPLIKQLAPAFDEEHPLYDLERSTEHIGQLQSVYVNINDSIRDIQNAITDEHTEILLLSNQGMPQERYIVNLNTWLHKNGYFVYHPSDQTALNDPDLQITNGINWEQTKAFSMGAGTLQINLQNREENGSVNPIEFDALVNELQDKLQAWHDHRWLTWNEPVVQSVTRSKNQKDVQPDLQVHFHPHYTESKQQVSVLSHPHLNLIQDIETPSSTISHHAANGLMLTSIKKDTAAHLSIYDIHSLILDYFGTEIPGT